MTTEPNPPQNHDEPNEAGFAGEPTTPQPAGRRSAGEDVAVPADDLTGAVSGGIEDATGRDHQ